jgi:hypothetical protein
MSDWVSIVVAFIGLIGALGGPVGVVLIQKARKEQEEFRIENDIQHGRSMDTIREVLVTAKETRLDLRELRQDFEDHLDDHMDMQLED